MKVSIEAEDDAKQEAVEAEVEPAEGTDTNAVNAELDPDEERARVEAAIRAGEQAAEDDFKADADKMRAQRDELQKQLDSVADEIATAKQQAADSAERLVRLQADWDNYRRRTAAERIAERERAAEKLVFNLLPVLDDMERACEHAAQNSADDVAVMQFVEGVNAVHDKMLNILSKEGVEVIDPAGQAFDPLIHQAVGRVEDPESFDETVAQVYQKGYSMGDKIIRNAMVTVTYGGPKRPVDDQTPSSKEDTAQEESSSGEQEE